ncbi:hypothetical protein CLF_104126 [Clonorchis sinensis]|uniref:Uncharacterized protein n=1 Tax=Clonorchis sinensis TaxID=79923 RepID=G7YB15_CLOSI|nr:hypothetical protein CLF_104126 [Clonorchis sinensis]
MHLYVVTILGGLVCSQVLGNPLMKPIQKTKTGLHLEKIVHKSNESSVNEQTASPAAVKKNTQKDQAMPENVVAVVGSSANSSAHSPEQTASSTPDSNGDDLQTSSTPNSREQIQHAGRWWPDVDVILECPCDDSDAEPQTKCPCSYGKLRALINSVRSAEYVLEDVMLHLKRTRKLEKIVSTVLNSVARKLRATLLPM